jgi:hypothetical protein
MNSLAASALSVIAPRNLFLEEPKNIGLSPRRDFNLRIFSPVKTGFLV